METLVSIVIVGIIGVCLLSIFANKSRIDSRTITNYNLGETVKSDFEMFSYDPLGFKQYYNLQSDEEKKINFDSKFDQIVNNETGNYYLITFTDAIDNGGYYRLKIKIYCRYSLRKFGDEEYLIRNVYGG